MEAEISESLSRLRQIGSELGVGEESQTEAIEEDSFDYTERVLFSEIREIKNVILSFFIHSSWSSAETRNLSSARIEGM